MRVVLAAGTFKPCLKPWNMNKLAEEICNDTNIRQTWP